MLKDNTVIVIGAGFYGVILALELTRYFAKVILVERESSILMRASRGNQARVHNGYHYPRSIRTAYSSRRNYIAFNEDFHHAIVNNFSSYYAIATDNSSVSANEFEEFCRAINAPYSIDKLAQKKYFDSSRVQEVYRVNENAFNVNHMMDILTSMLASSNVELILETEVLDIENCSSGYTVHCNGGKSMKCNDVYLCTYSNINTVLRRSKLQNLPIRYELAELALVEVPDKLTDTSFTIMDGPFFSLFPYPSTNQYTLSHVEHTPHLSWTDNGVDGLKHADSFTKPGVSTRKSNYRKMIQNASAYVPSIAELKYIDSIWEIKATLQSTEKNDSRPIVVAKLHHSLYAVLGSKIDNVADMVSFIKKLYGHRSDKVMY